VWKRFVPNPYRWWIRNLDLGFVLDVGCGIGRTLRYLDGHGVGVDHNESSVAYCVEQGLQAFTPDEFARSEFAVGTPFDALILLHVLEHLEGDDGDHLIGAYLKYVKPGGRVVLVTPQERGFASDPTHTQFVVDTDHVALCARLGLRVIRSRSFPLPRWFGKAFRYNEFTTIAQKPA